MAKIHGIQKIEIGPIGVNGAPGADLDEITAIQLESVVIDIPVVEGNDLYVEEIDSVYDSLDNAEPDPITVSFATYKADNETLNTIFGGELTAGGQYTPERQGVERTIKVYGKVRDGVQKVFTFPRAKVRPSMSDPLTKSALTSVTGTATAMTPYDGDGAALKEFYMEDILVP